MIDLKSDTPEKDRLHTEIFDTAKTMDEKMSEDKGSIGTQYEEEEEEKGGALRKRRRSEEDEEEAEEEEEEEEDTSVMRSELPPGRRECQQLKEHTTCLANHTNRNGCFLRQLMMDRLKRWINPQAKEDAEESYPDMDPE